MNILEELFFDNLSGNGQLTRDSKLGETLDQIEEMEKHLLKHSKDKYRKILIHLINEMDNALSIASEEQYIKGFRVGARFMLDTFVIDPNCILREP